MEGGRGQRTAGRAEGAGGRTCEGPPSKGCDKAERCREMWKACKTDPCTHPPCPSKLMVASCRIVWPRACGSSTVSHMCLHVCGCRDGGGWGRRDRRMIQRAPNEAWVGSAQVGARRTEEEWPGWLSLSDRSAAAHLSPTVPPPRKPLGIDPTPRLSLSLSDAPRASLQPFVAPPLRPIHPRSYRPCGSWLLTFGTRTLMSMFQWSPFCQTFDGNITRSLPMSKCHGSPCSSGPALAHSVRKGSPGSAAFAREMLEGSGGESYKMTGPIGSGSSVTDPSQALPFGHGFGPTASFTRYLGRRREGARKSVIVMAF